MYKALQNDEIINGDYRDYACIPQTPAWFTENHGVIWEFYEEDGLGKAALAGFRHVGGKVLMMRHLFQDPIPSTSFELLNSDKSNSRMVEDALSHFQIRSNDLLWIHDLISLRQCSLYRQDDNGVEYKVAEFTSYSDATIEMSRLSKGSHKQFYEIRTNQYSNN